MNLTTKQLGMNYRSILCAFVILMMSIGGVTAQTTKKKSTKKPSNTKKTEPSSTVAREKSNLSIDEIPQPLQGVEFKFPDYEEFTLPNGLTVFVVENHDLPTISIEMMFKGGETYDPKGKEGTASLMADMLGKGTKTRTAQEIATSLDGVGSSLSITTAGEGTSVSAYSLRKHVQSLLTILGDELQNPIFDETEFEKLKKQYAASIASRKSRPAEMAQALSRKVVYGFDNMLGRHQTEKSVNAVTRQDVVDMYTTYVRPNNAAVAIVGDVTPKEVKEWLTKHFVGWEKGPIPPQFSQERELEPPGVYFISRKGAVQSAVVVCGPAPASTDLTWEAGRVLAEYFGVGFGSVLFSTLRETYSYCYSPFGSITSSKRYNRIVAGAEVRNSVTDSSINVILKEMRRVVAEGPDEMVFNRRISYMAGRYRMAFERPGLPATLALNAWLTEVPMERTKTYLNRLENMSLADVHESARQLFNPFNLRFVVVGSPDVRSKLEQFGPVYEYNADLERVEDSPMEPAGVSVEDLIAKYKEAIGGAAVDAVKTIEVNAKMSMTMQGNASEGTFTRTVKVPNKEVSSIIMPTFVQQQWVDGNMAWVSMQDGPASEAAADEKQQLLIEARAFPVLTWLADSYKVSVEGKQGGVIIVKAVAPTGRNEKYFFDATNFLLVKSEKEIVTPQGMLVMVDRFENYTTVDGVKLPGIVKTQNQYYSMTLENSYKLNVEVADTEFAPTTE